MTGNGKPLLRVTVFSDYLCPFCYLGWLRLERLRVDYDLRVNWCMTEIHADNPTEAGHPPTDMGYTPGQWQRLVSDIEVVAAEEGVCLAGLRYSTNSHKALLLAEAAKVTGAEAFYALHRRLFEVYLCEGLNLADEQVLRGLVRELGLDPGLPDRAWGEPRYEQRLREAARAARELGVDATPTFYFDRNPLRGLQSVETLQAAARGAVK